MKRLRLPALCLLILLQGLTFAPRIRASGCELLTNCIGTTLQLCESNFAMFPGVTYTYQWIHWPGLSVTNVLAGETNPCLSRIIESTYDAGIYQVTITGTIEGESVTNTPCGATVIVPLILLGSPATTNCYFFGSRVVVYPEVFGGTPLSYQWRKNNVLLPHQTNLVLTLDCYKASDAGHYLLEAATTCGAATASIDLPAPVLFCGFSGGTSQISVPQGGSFSNYYDSVVMFEGVNYSFQWVKRESGSNYPIAGLTNQFIAMTNVAPSDTGDYTSVLTASVCGETMVANLSLLRLIVVPTIQNPRRLASGAFEFTYEYPGPNAPLFSVRASSDPAQPFFNWQYVGTATSLGGGLHRFTDPQATNHPRRFYRLR